MRPKSLPSLARLRTLFDPDFEAGLLYRKKPDGSRGKVAGSENYDGYVNVAVDRKMYGTHRILWYMYHGKEPRKLLRRDGNKANNAISNLSEIADLGLPAGVSKTQHGKYRAQCYIRGRQYYLGLFRTIDEAIQAQKDKRAEVN